MRHWSGVLDINLLRPSAFERRRREEEQQQRAYHRPTSSTASLPTILPSRFLSFASSSPTTPRTNVPSLVLPLPRTLSNSDQHQNHFHGQIITSSPNSPTSRLSSRGRFSNFLPFSGGNSNRRFLFPATATTNSSDLSLPSSSRTPTPIRREEIGIRSEESIGTSFPSNAQQIFSGAHLRLWQVMTGSNTSRQDQDWQERDQNISPRSFFHIGWTWNGNGHHLGSLTEAAAPSLSEEEQGQILASRESSRGFVFLARPPSGSGTDMTPRVSRIRRHAVEEDNSNQSFADASASSAFQGQGQAHGLGHGHELGRYPDAEQKEITQELVVTPFPTCISPGAGEMSPSPTARAIEPSSSMTMLLVAAVEAGTTIEIENEEVISSAAMGGSNDVILSQSTSSVAATISASVSRTDPSSRQATPAPLSILPSRLSVDDSDVNATLSRLQAEQLQLQIQQLPPPPITEEQLRIHNQRRYLRKFMCLIATLPVVATLAIYNKIELAMLWWVIVLPVIGISVALYLNRKLGQRLEYLQEQAQTSRRSLLTASRATRFSSSNSDGRDELATPSPPPDYQSSIITPPAYITAQQPRKVPSYRSLENLFSRARQGVTARTSRRGSESSAVVILAGTTEQDAQQQQQDCLQYRVLTIAEEHSDVANTSSSTFDTSSSNDHRQQDLGKSIQETITITLRNAPEMVEIRSAWQNHLSAGCSHGASSSSPSNTSASVMVMTRSSSSNTTNIELTTDSITDPKGKRPVRE